MLVNAMVQLTCLTRSSDADGSDCQPVSMTMAFSYVMSLDLAHIYVHFRQSRQDGRSLWYMAKVSGTKWMRARILNDSGEISTKIWTGEF